GVSCHLNFLKQVIEPSKEVTKSEKKRLDSSIRSAVVDSLPPRVPIGLIQDIHVKNQKTTIKFDGSQELVQGLLQSGEARIFGDDPGQRMTETVTECVYNNQADGIDRVNYAYMEIH
ncbi:hypothetical protein ACHAXS_000338, partial [Conticribra weissflogii]